MDKLDGERSKMEKIGYKGRTRSENGTRGFKGGLYSAQPLNQFYEKGFDYVPICSWLRLCPFNTVTNRWHIPMRNGRMPYWVVYDWLRNKSGEYEYNINLAMDEDRGCFFDEASRTGKKDFWFVADRWRGFDQTLLGQSSEEIRWAPSFERESLHSDTMLPAMARIWPDEVKQQSQYDLETVLKQFYDKMEKRTEEMKKEARQWK